MNIVYKILWIDDSDDFVESAEELISQTIVSNHMDPEIKKYSSFVEFERGELNRFDENTFNLYDQILVDFALSGATGDEIIKNIRARNIFTDIVFYSSNYDSMINNVKNKGQLDGVFFARREDLTSVVNNVVKKNIKRETCIANVRGIIMDGTSEFDYICKNVSIELFDKLSSEAQKKVFNKAISFVENAKTKSTYNFSTLSVLETKQERKKYLEKTLFSVDYIIDNKDRYELFSMIAREFEFGKQYDSLFAQAYYDALIKPRNDLAHAKLYYGDCNKKLHIAKRRQSLKCNKDCQNCTSKYDVEKCETIRKDIYDYYKGLEKLFSETGKLQ